MTIGKIGGVVGHFGGQFVKGWFIGAGFCLGVLNMWAYLGGVQ